MSKIKYSYTFEKCPDWSDKTILIYETDFGSACLLDEMLSATKVRIIHVYQKTEMEKFYDRYVDLIIFRIDMKEMETGLKLTRKIRLRYPGRPLIAYTEYPMYQNSSKICFDIGCNEVIVKTFEYDHFEVILTKYLRQLLHQKGEVVTKKSDLNGQ
jgi:CheY-like chemotaxis protein